MKFNILDEAKKIKLLMLSGQITYDEAIEMLQPKIAEANERAKKIAKEFGRSPPLITATKLLRQ